MTPRFDRMGSIGSVIAAAACPICFPKLALVGGLLGLGALSSYEAQLIVAAQALVALAVAGHLLAYRQRRNAGLLGVALASGAAVFAGLYLGGSEWLAYAGFAGLVGASSYDVLGRLRGAGAASILTCPKCGFKRKETMPRDACLFFYECSSCGALLRPKAGDCCVFCSYGTVKCPPKQLA